MLSSITIDGYRSLNHFEMKGLGRVNLLVGLNNSGKTSVLEAISLFASGNDFFPIWLLSWRRGDVMVPPPAKGGEPGRSIQPEAMIGHMFFGHEIHVGSQFSITAANRAPERKITFSIVELSPQDLKDLPQDELPFPGRVGLKINSAEPPIENLVPLSRLYGLTSETFTPARRRHPAKGVTPSVFVSSELSNSNELLSYWNKIALRPQAQLVLRALKFIEPTLEGITAQASAQPYYGPITKGGFIVKMEGIEQPVPVGSMGDGIWRMLSLALSITQCRGGIMLVDEIDAGLHYSVMARMWQLIFNAAKEFDVQVFATTHSYDCVNSLAHICATADEQNPVAIHRVERGASRSVPYGEEEIKVIADRDIEVRGVVG
jgi:hypothetical protein